MVTGGDIPLAKENPLLQAILQKPETISFLDVPIPEPGEGQALIEVKRIGICGSDIHVYQGRHKYAILPVVKAMKDPELSRRLDLELKNWFPGTG
jgi:hypothetical protein